MRVCFLKSSDDTEQITCASERADNIWPNCLRRMKEVPKIWKLLYLVAALILILILCFRYGRHVLRSRNQQLFVPRPHQDVMDSGSGILPEHEHGSGCH